MDFEEFKEALVKDMKTALDFRLETNTEVEIKHNTKTNYSYEALNVRPEGAEVGVSIDCNKLYAAYTDGVDYRDIIAGMTDQLEKSLKDGPGIDIDMFSDYAQLKDKLSIEVISAERNKDILESVPHKNLEDMAIVYRFNVGRTPEGMGTVLVTNDMLDKYGITAEELHADALKSAPEIRPVVIKGMSEFLVEMMGNEQASMLGFEPVEDEPVLVASVPDNIKGAGIIAYTDFMDKAAERIGGECLGLTWNDLNFKERTISVNHTLTDRPDEHGHTQKRIETPKTKAGTRIIPMVDEVFDAFLDEYQIQKCLGFCEEEIDGYKDFVFSTASHTVYLASAVNHAIHRAADSYNEKEKHRAEYEEREPLLLPTFSAHNLRHTFCTRLCENDVNLKVIQTIMGHSDITTTMNIYADCHKEKKKEALDSIKGKLIL